MNKIIISFFLIFGLGSQAQAKRSPTFCSDVEKMANLAITKRQEGVRLSRIIEVFDKTTTGSYKKLSRTIAYMAYEENLGHTAREKKDIIDAYTNKWALNCYKNLENEKKKSVDTKK